MFHLVGYESTGSFAALTAITPIPDGTVNITGNDIRIDPALPNVVGVAASINSAAATLRAQLITPSLRAIFPYDICSITNGLVFGNLPSIDQLWDVPLGLVALESMDVFVQNGAAVLNRAFVWLSDGAIKPVTGKVYSVRATATATLLTASWVNSGTLTFASVLPAGTYQVVGMRAWSANGVAARIFFVSYPWRPGVLMLNTASQVDWPTFRWGNYGVYGQFLHTTPPTIDFMGITDTAEVIYFDLIKTA